MVFFFKNVVYFLRNSYSFKKKKRGIAILIPLLKGIVILIE